jgi:hypothetical protein
MPKLESISIGNYLTYFKSICGNLVAIQKPISYEDNTVQLSWKKNMMCLSQQ